MDNSTIEQKRQRIAQAVRSTDATETSAWNALDSLSSQTAVDSVEIFEQEIRIEPDHFEGPITWYVMLQYAPRAGEDSLTISESFPGTFRGHFEGGEPIVDDMTVDTASFYA